MAGFTLKPGEELNISWDAWSALRPLDEHDIMALLANDLPIRQWYDLMKWWTYNNPEYVLHPSVKWACAQRAHELAELTR